MAHKRGHNGSANDDPLAFGFNQKVYGDVVSQQVRLAKQTESLRKSQREAMAKELAAETAKINALAADPKNMYTEGDRTGAISAAEQRIKSRGSFIPTTFDFSRIANVVNKDTFGPGSISNVLKKEAKKKKQRYLD
jgi:hypothetical protein